MIITNEKVGDILFISWLAIIINDYPKVRQGRTVEGGGGSLSADDPPFA